jgi:toxin ParE2
MNVRLFEAVQAELDAAIAYYNAERSSLGDELLIEFLSTVDRIKTYPNGWSPFHLETRRCRLRRFPYGVIYLVEKNEIVIAAFAHLHRKPDYWVGRIST